MARRACAHRRRISAPIGSLQAFTPTGGITMGTRSGDIDPTVVLYLIREKKARTIKLRW
jgi:acetate kinase